MAKVRNLLNRCKEDGMLTQEEISNIKIYVILLRRKLDYVTTVEKEDLSYFINLYADMRYLKLMYDNFLKRREAMWLMQGIGGYLGYYSTYLDNLIKLIEDNLNKPVLTAELCLPEYSIPIEKMRIYCSRALSNLNVYEYARYYNTEKIQVLQEIGEELNKNYKNDNNKIEYLKRNILEFEYIIHVLLLSCIN